MELSALTIQQLRYLVAVEEHRSFRDAAGACHVSQPALSMQLKKLEDLLGFCVFDRSRQPVIPTERGVQVVAQARLVLGHVQRIGTIVNSEDELAGSYRLGIIPTLASTFVPTFLPAMARRHPRVELEIVEEKTDVLLRRLRDGSLDGGLAATPLDVPGIHEEVVCHEAFFAYLHPGHPLLRAERVHQSDLVGEQLWLLSEGHCFRTQILHLCSADRRPGVGEVGRVTFDAGSFETLVRLVDGGMGITILPELVVRQLSPEQRAAQARPFVAPEPVREIGLLTTRTQVRREITEALFQVMRASVPGDVVGRKPEASTIVKPRNGEAHG